MAPVRFFEDTDDVTLIHWYIVDKKRKVLPVTQWIYHAPWHDDNGPASGMEVGNPPFEPGPQYVRRFGGGAKNPLPTSGYDGVHFCGTPEQWRGPLRHDRPLDLGRPGCCPVVNQGGVAVGGGGVFEFAPGPSQIGGVRLGGSTVFSLPPVTLYPQGGVTAAGQSYLFGDFGLGTYGGSALSGSSVWSVEYSVLATGGTRMGGSARWQQSSHIAGSASVLASGAASRWYTPITKLGGSVRMDGPTKWQQSQGFTGSGGLLVSGTGPIQSGKGYPSSGSVRVGGSFFWTSGQGSASFGRILLDGRSSFWVYRITFAGSSGLLLGGQSTWVYNGVVIDNPVPGS